LHADHHITSLQNGEEIYISLYRLLISFKAPADAASLAAVPTPLHITLLFKCARHTVLLSTLPSTPFSEIKSLLLLALQSRSITSIADSSVPPPDQAERVEFGVPKNKKDLTRGFVSLEMADEVLADSKGGKKRVNGDRTAPKETPASAGLVDGSVLAFRFKPEHDVGPEDDDDDNDNDEALDPGWNVELPRYDDEED